jgi:phosphoserine phosphatase
MTSSGTTPQAQTANDPIEAGGWFPENLAQITGRWAAIAAQPATAKPVAIFDFDNTCIFRDVGQAVFRYQAQYLRYRLRPEQLAAILPTIDGDLAGRPVITLTTALLDAYRVLYPLLITKRQEQALLLPEARLFASLLLWLTDQARKDERLGPRYVLPFMGKLLAGFSTAELRLLAVEVVEAVRTEPLGEERLTVDAPEPIGRIEANYPLGLHAYPEMLTLMHWLARQGIERYVISASTEWLVEGAAQLLGFPVTVDHVFGIRVQLDAGEVLTTNDPPAYPVTFREGKAAIIKQWIGGRTVLVAGDADTDFEMLTLPEVEIRLLINRRQRGLISSLYEDPRILLQGVDLATGCFRPSRESIGP